MVKIRFSFFLIVAFFQTFVLAQEQNYITGTITNIENNEPLPFATVTLKNHPIGTTSNDEGAFDFYIPPSKRLDTLAISFMGFNTYYVPVLNIKNPINIQLRPAENILDEVIVSRYSPLEYIQKAIENLDKNYAQDPYQSLAYYREKFIENNQTIKKDEGIFKTYYAAAKDTLKNQHQLVLFRQAENPQSFQFMREWIEKKAAKEKKKALKKGEEIDEEDYDGNIDMDFGGPQSVINLDLRNNDDNFLKPKHFKKYEYTFGEETSLNGESMVTIHFKAKRKIDYIRDEGTVIISKETYAIVHMEQKGKLSIPFVVKPILLVVGLKIKNPKFQRTVSYQKYKDLWYPSLFRWDADVNLTKTHTFSANEHSAISIGQVFLINKIDTTATAIPKEKRFDAGEDMAEQVFNDDYMTWEGLNMIKD